MKKVLTLLLVLLSVFGLAGCGNPTTQYETVNEMEGVTLELKADTLKATSGTFLLTNDTEAEINYRDAYHMEKKDADGNWKEFVGTANATWGEETVAVPAGETVELPINWKNLCGGIGAGEFRLIIEVDGNPIAAEFVRE
ncbi:immunoglobulin-like domain-containing protein [Anaerotignum sp.]|uniref:immunoglobulin-like domain-containing protein n=1 Tax=Anaerotignum sp. TaxID=2039241 RepID=UPI00373555E8